MYTSRSNISSEAVESHIGSPRLKHSIRSTHIEKLLYFRVIYSFLNKNTIQSYTLVLLILLDKFLDQKPGFTTLVLYRMASVQTTAWFFVMICTRQRSIPIIVFLVVGCFLRKTPGN